MIPGSLEQSTVTYMLRKTLKIQVANKFQDLLFNLVDRILIDLIVYRNFPL